jgi:glycosyltransferase involved in cell wall biosynthesis
MSGSRFAVAIPAFEAALTLAPVVSRTLAIHPDVIVVDDGSGDGTGDVARACGVPVLAHPVNFGKGRALKTAFDHLFAQVDELERWMLDGRLNNVSPGEPEVNETDLQSFLEAEL